VAQKTVWTQSHALNRWLRLISIGQAVQ
jgi:hypothetical protein